eukprot:TRINITY_DN76433_c0_g1_i1.p1 TRINITY_DN76433_c0_g1~~TRINITY_DN76433_c0_g1_i1.p1  ORF type:complete len:340 (-),score=78.43 TRINITY_DN76433_c0_g1_i1:47-1003(-)
MRSMGISKGNDGLGSMSRKASDPSLRRKTVGAGLGRTAAALVLGEDRRGGRQTSLPPEPRIPAPVASTPVPATAYVKAAKDDKGSDDISKSLNIRSLQLSKKYRIEFFEVKAILESLDKAEKTPGGSLSSCEFTKFLKEAFSIEKVPRDLVNKLHVMCCGEKGREKEFDIPGFLDWYVAALFTDVAALRADQKMASHSNLTDALCERFGLCSTDLDKVKRAFDKYDTDGSGQIDQQEFANMMAQMMGAKAGDIPEERLKGFWREIDKDGSGEVDFAEFAEWYLRYFDPSIGDATAAFYKSYNPSAQRQSHLSRQVSED